MWVQEPHVSLVSQHMYLDTHLHHSAFSAKGKSAEDFGKYSVLLGECLLLEESSQTQNDLLC